VSEFDCCTTLPAPPAAVYQFLVAPLRSSVGWFPGGVPWRSEREQAFAARRPPSYEPFAGRAPGPLADVAVAEITDQIH